MHMVTRSSTIYANSDRATRLGPFGWNRWFPRVPGDSALLLTAATSGESIYVAGDGCNRGRATGVTFDRLRQFSRPPPQTPQTTWGTDTDLGTPGDGRERV